ncbi:MAG: hypothetical protein WC865_06170 [Bacteroidales bacterium]
MLEGQSLFPNDPILQKAIDINSTSVYSIEALDLVFQRFKFSFTERDIPKKLISLPGRRFLLGKFFFHSSLKKEPKKSLLKLTSLVLGQKAYLYTLVFRKTMQINDNTVHLNP